MATTTITESSFQTACAECADAIIASDWSTAREKYAVAEAINAGLAVQVERESMVIRRRESLSGLRDAIDAVAGQVTGASDRKRFVRTALAHG